MNILICDNIREEARKLENALKEASQTADFEVNMDAIIQIQRVMGKDM